MITAAGVLPRRRPGAALARAEPDATPAQWCGSRRDGPPYNDEAPMRDPMTLAQALAAEPTYRLAVASLACIATEDDFGAWVARFVPFSARFETATKAELWRAMRRAARNIGLEDRDVRAIVDEVMAAARAADGSSEWRRMADGEEVAE